MTKACGRLLSYLVAKVTSKKVQCAVSWSVINVMHLTNKILLSTNFANHICSPL